MNGFLLALILNLAIGQSDFNWPKEEYSFKPEEWRPIALADAPLNFIFGGSTDEGSIDHAEGIYADLRGDGRKQLFINNGSGGSAGRGWSIYDKVGGKWKLIGTGCGEITLCSKLHGYYQIEVWSRGGGGAFTKELLRYQGDRYHLVRLEDWKDTDDFGHRAFVDAQDPKPFDTFP